MKKEFVAIAMKCNQEQFDAVKPKLEGKIEFYSVSKREFEKYDYLVNCDSGRLSNVNKSGFKHIWCQSPEIHETWNEKVFLEACGIEVEETKVNILTLSEPIGDYVIFNGKKYVPEVVALEPEKKELVVGKWYWYDGTLFNYQLGDDVYGFEPDGSWCTAKLWSWPVSYGYDREALQQEVEEALKAETVRRGYKKGNHKCLNSPIVENHLEDVYSFEEGKLWYGGKYANCVFVNGVWSEIIQPKKMTQAEAELMYNIEIV